MTKQRFNIHPAWMLPVGFAVYHAARSLIALSQKDAFSDKVVLITGGERGLGLVMARQLASEGAWVAICGLHEAEVERAGQDLGRISGRVMALRCDVTDLEQVRATIATVQQSFGSIDVLINNAGVIIVGPIKTMELRDYGDAMATHFWGPLHTITELLPGMRARGSGHIVNIASIGAKISTPHLVAYCASKAALMGLSNGLRAELVDDGIKVTTVCAGLMTTGGHLNTIYKGDHRGEYAWFSIIDALPGFAASANQAARRIIRAAKRGDAEIYVTTQANLIARLAGLFPNITIGLLTLMNQFLPKTDSNDPKRWMGFESQSKHSPSALSARADRAAVQNNELGRVQVD